MTEAETRYRYHHQPRPGDLVIVHRDDTEANTVALVMCGWLDGGVRIAIPGRSVTKHVSFRELEPVGALPAYTSAEAS